MKTTTNYKLGGDGNYDNNYEKTQDGRRKSDETRVFASSHYIIIFKISKHFFFGVSPLLYTFDTSKCLGEKFIFKKENLGRGSHPRLGFEAQIELLQPDYVEIVG